MVLFASSQNRWIGPSDRDQYLGREKFDMKITLEVLRVLDAIDRTGTFASAAGVLNKVPSAVSYVVQKLEGDIGVELFDRSRRRATLTPAGRVVVEEGRLLLQAADDLEHKAKRVQEGWESEFRIGIDEIIPLGLLWDHIETFYKLNLNTELRLSKEVLGGTWDALVMRRADLVVGATGAAPSIPNLVVKPIGTLRHIFVVAPNHPLALLAEPLTIETVARYRAVAIGDTSRKISRRTIALAPGQEVLTVPNLEAKLTAQIKGLGAGTMPECVAAEAVGRGELVQKRVVGLRDKSDLYMAWRDNEGGRALHWWAKTLSRPDLIENVVKQIQLMECPE